ncbi:MAG: SAM-dependent chlorinase/fluorinase [Acidobacteriota bacterium]|nr:SAM-dependent chlorinase/fluorinase [Acidobacteriota bacterium]
MQRQPLVTLTTDFGLSDHFVGTMKGVMLRINPLVHFADITHQVAPQDIFDGALALSLAYPYFPKDAIHLVIVDPGVGSSRRPLIVRARGGLFVAPDNGVLSFVYEREGNAEAWHVTQDRFFLKPVSNTFHGRDVFAPVAAWLSKGIEPAEFGEPVSDYVRFAIPKPKVLKDGSLLAEVIKVDQFGNLFTNVSVMEAPELFAPKPPSFRLVINQQEITSLHSSYSMGKPGEFFAIAGSSGFLEVGQNRASAAKGLVAGKGTQVVISWIP